jgi:S1-C subfamily serine protease
VTASHVLALCPDVTTISVGDGTATVSSNDRAHDLALLSYQSPDPLLNRRNLNPKPLEPESRPAYVGERLALLGIPARPLLGDPFTPQVTVVQGTVVAINQTRVLTTSDGGRETLTDAILVAGQGVASGESGGPAIDRAGKVVGVIEGSGSGVATLTPVRDVTTPH